MSKDKYKYCGIYLIQIDKYNYVGQSIDITNRIKQHKKRLKQGKHHNNFMQNVFNKYKTFSYKILWKGDASCLTLMEQNFINFFKLNNLNLCKAGHYTEQHRLSISIGNKNSKANIASLNKARLIGAAKPKTEAQLEVAQKWAESMNTPEANAKSAKSRLNNSAVKNAARNRKRSDFSIYTIQNKKTREVFVGTRSEFAEKYTINSGRTSDLIRRGYYKHWFITHVNTVAHGKESELSGKPKHIMV